MTTLESPTESILFLGSKSTKETLAVDDFCAEIPSSAPYWIHFSIENPVASNWLKDKSGIDPLLIESMLAQKVRQKAIIQEDSLLLILRVADTLEVTEHEELQFLRIYVDSNKIITTSLYPLPVIKELTEKWKELSDKTAKVVDLFLDLTIDSVRGLEAILESVENQADTLERQVLGVGEDPEDSDIANLSLDALDLRRCLVPQREVLARVAEADLVWLKSHQKKRLKRIHERTCRQLDETEVIRDRTRIIREQRNSHVAEQVNQRLYIFSVAAVVFLPLSFLTGLLGVNLGGIPGADSPMGFLGFCNILIVLTAVMVMAFKRFKWL